MQKHTVLRKEGKEGTGLRFTDFAAGEVLLVDKPAGWTSFDVVAKVRNTIGIKKVGHAGTLDPMANGLLILCTGKMTKEIDRFMGMEKEYLGTMVFGATTPSYDAETEIDRRFPLEDLSAEKINLALDRFRGWIEQVPPAYSAVKMDGKRAYELARKGKEVNLKPRKVEIREFAVSNIALPEAAFKVVCSKGTYIRSLVHDLGESLGNGAYLSSLQRTRIGNLQLSDAWNLQELINAIREHKTKVREGLPESG